VLRGWLAYDQAWVAMGKPDTVRGEALAGWIGRGVEYAERALRLRADAPDALELRGSLRYRGWAFAGLSGRPADAQDLAAAEHDLRRAAAVSGPSQARALSLLSAVLQFSGNVAESNLAAQRAYEVDAYLSDASTIVLRLFDTSLELGRYAEAGEWCDRGRQAFPAEWTFRMCRLTLMAWSPEEEADVPVAWQVLAEIDTVAAPGDRSWLHPQMTMMVAAVVAAAGLPDSAERVTDRARAEAPADPELPYYEALARVRLGQRAEAAEQLAMLLRRSPNFEAFLRSHSAFKSLWSDPRLRTPDRSP
jgi:tetratricopeptide (TPR) repeat protein